MKLLSGGNRFTFLLLIFTTLASNATFSNYNSILIGDEAAGMAGAATAVVGDASACSWYNPATCALLTGRSFSAAVGIYKKFDTLYGDNQDLVAAGMKVNQGFFQPLPSSTGSVVRFKDFLQDYTIGLSIVTPEYDTFKGDLGSSSTSKTTLSTTDQSLWVGSSISRKISKDEAFGLTIYYTARTYSKSLTDRQFVSSNSTTIYQEEKAYTQNALVFNFGYLYSFPENWKIGFSIRFPSMHIAGSGAYFDSLITGGTAGTTETTNNLMGLTSKSHIPAKYTLGISYEEPRSIIIAADISTYSYESYRDFESDVPGVAEYIENRQIVNVSAGMDFLIRKWLKMRIGGFTNFSAHPDPDKNKVRGQGDHVDQLGWAANWAMRSGNITYTFGGYYTGGRGRSVQRINQTTDVIAKTQQVFTMLVGTSYNY
jgi:hypothetical protein